MSSTNPFDDGPVDPFESGSGQPPAQQEFNPFASNSQDEGDNVTNQKQQKNFASQKVKQTQQQLQKLAQKLRGGSNRDKDGVDDSDDDMGDENGDEKWKNNKPKEWKYDDFHLVQEKYYEVLDQQKQEPSNEEDTSSSTPAYMMRPPDLPNIPTAVQGLPLVKFSETAQERAIGIVSTWIFDNGLMDELLAGGSHGMTMAAAAAKSSKDGAGGGPGGTGTDGEEGVEVGPHGFPMEGPQKMDKEMDILREKTQRELALINNRLNDGVAASGSEVQELVNAVTTTKSDLIRLRQLMTYISTGGNNNSMSSSGNNGNTYLLTNYPKLKTAVHASRNLSRCFRELDFFAQIPATCDRLRDQLNACEWTDHEWTTIRDVCREHVELQVFLVEAEAGMKSRQEEEASKGQHHDPYSAPTNYMTRSALQRKANSFRYQPTHENNDAVDTFLKDHVKNVWELGDELQFRLLSGIGSAFDLAQANPSGLVALVEAVESYEHAADEFKRVHGKKMLRSKASATTTSSNAKGNSSSNLTFTDMRGAALEHIAQDFDERGQEVFQSLMVKAADDAGSRDDNDTAIFNAILRAANNLTYQMELVTTSMSPCFPPKWNVETLWMTCVAAICSQHILQQIGGQEGNNLEYMTVTQLLDLVAWIESFCHKVEYKFPDILKKSYHAKKTKFISVKELLAGKEIDMQTAKENMEHVVHVLWDIHRLAQDQFIVRTQKQTNDWLEKVYDANHAKQQTSEGHLTTSLPEDVWALAGVQLRTIRERLTKRSTVLVDASSIVFRLMQLKQRSTRNRFLIDIETCCAAANDFLRMTEQAEEVLTDLEGETELSEDNRGTLEDVANELMRQYSNDAVYAAQAVHKYVFEPIEEELGEGLFESTWETELTHNEMAWTLVRTIEDFMSDLKEWMEAIMVRKTVDAMVKASINFYLKRLLKKANKRNVREATFDDNQVALRRIAGDIKVMREYFEGLVDEFPALERVINEEFAVLGGVFDLMCIAAGLSESDFLDYLPILQKRIKNVNVTRMLVGDLWHLMNPAEERDTYERFASQEDTLKAFDINDTYVDEQYIDGGLQLDRVVIGVVGDSQRRRPLKGDAVKAIEKLFAKHGKPWHMEIEEEEYEGEGFDT